MDDAAQRYHRRMQRVLDHIDRYLDDDLSLTTLAGVAAFSPHHFHRQFAATFGLTLHRYVQLVRMKQASYRLAFRDARVTDAALDTGYAAPDSFARTFRQRLGQSPSGFRDSPEWEAWHAALEPLEQARRTMPETFTPDDVMIRETDDTRVAVLAHRGDSRRIGESIRRFIAWRKAHGLGPHASATFNIFHSPRDASPEEYRVDLCAGIDAEIPPNDAGVVAGLIPGGRCAVLRVTGSGDDLEPAATWLFRDWLPASGAEMRDFPIYCQRLSFFPDVPESEAVTELFLPLR